jgi:hypothetical protein
MMRTTLAVAAGFVAWVVVVTLGNLLLRAILPGYAVVEAAMAFTPLMLVARLTLGVAASLAAGYVGSVVGRQRPLAVPVLAGLLALFFLVVHLKLWDKFPGWYHIIFLGTLAPLVLLGGRLHRRSKAASVTPGSTDGRPS